MRRRIGARRKGTRHKRKCNVEEEDREFEQWLEASSISEQTVHVGQRKRKSDDGKEEGKSRARKPFRELKTMKQAEVRIDELCHRLVSALIDIDEDFCGDLTDLGFISLAYEFLEHADRYSYQQKTGAALLAASNERRLTPSCPMT